MADKPKSTQVILEECRREIVINQAFADRGFVLGCEANLIDCMSTGHIEARAGDEVVRLESQLLRVPRLGIVIEVFAPLHRGVSSRAVLEHWWGFVTSMSKSQIETLIRDRE